MTALLIVVAAIVLLFIGYVFYGSWLAKQWGIDPTKKTPAIEKEDGVDYVAAKPAVLMGHHFSSIAGAGPINGPIQASIFGWVPVFLWCIIGGIFFGGLQDFGSLFASIRHDGKSVGEIIEDSMGSRAKKLFIIFALLVLILVIASFVNIVAGTFLTLADDAGKTAFGFVTNPTGNQSTAMISLLFIVLAVIYGYVTNRMGVKTLPATIGGIICIVAITVLGLNVGFAMNRIAWIVFVGVYIAVASLVPVWILLQPRDYLSSFLLYGMMILAVVGIVGCSPTVDMPAFTGFYDTLAPSGTSLGYMFPALFVTIACGAVSGFHSLVGSGTTSKQLDQEKDAKPIAYGGMLIECALALISVCAVGYIWNQYADGTTTTPTVVFATGLASMFSKVFGSGCYNVVYSMLILAVSAFCLTSVDTATRLARYMFAEFFVEPGKTREDLTGWKRVITNPYVATGITVVAGVALGLTGYAKIWALFGAANQLLAALGLLAVCCWLGKIGRNNKMFYFPMFFMLIVTLTSLVFTIKAQITGIMAGGEGVVWCYVRGIIGVLLVILAIDLVVEGIRALGRNKKAAQAAE